MPGKFRSNIERLANFTAVFHLISYTCCCVIVSVLCADSIIFIGMKLRIKDHADSWTLVTCEIEARMLQVHRGNKKNRLLCTK